MENSDHTVGDSEKVEGPGYTITVEAVHDILELAISGQATRENAQEIAQAFADVASRYDKPVLVDVRDVEGRLGVTDTYYHVRNHPHRRYKWKTAVIELPENASYYTFHEVTAMNAGLSLRYFHTHEEARAWLRE